MLDFGIAKLQQGSTGDSVKTRTGTLMGTPIYMSPEQCRGTKAIDHRSDIYSLGVILFEMLTGQPPFVSEGFGELVNMHLNVPAPAPSSRNPNVPAALDALVLKMLEKNPDQRFADMGELQVALKASGGTMFVVRGSPTSSPDLAKSPSKTTAAPVSMSNPKLGETTLSAGAGERTEVGRSSGKGKSIGLVLGVAAAAVVAGVFLFRDGEKVALQREGLAVKPAQPTTTAAPIPKTDPPVPAVPVEPPARKTVTVRVESEPPGASVVNDASGGVLGVTPLTLTRPRGGSLTLRLEKDGYNPNARAVSLEDDSTLDLTLEQKPKPRPRRPHASRPADDEPAKL